MMTSFATKYKVIQKIGEGSFSEVLKCEDHQTGALFAAKRLKKTFKTMTDVLSCAEIIAMHKLTRHPNVLYMIEYFYDSVSGKLVYVFELMDMSMYEFMKIKKRAMPEAKVKNYLYQMLKGLEHLHKNGLFHRDIKPENILVRIPKNTASNAMQYQQIELVKLADLGSIRGIYSRPPYTEYISTRWYRSPECLLSVGYYGPKMDIWAAGCVFYEMLTLKPLFPGTNEIDQLAKIHAVLGTPTARLINKLKKKSHNCENFPRQIGTGLTSLIGNFSEDCQNVLRIMVQYDPENRINVRRLIEHRYFTPLREQYVIGQFRYSTTQQVVGDTLSKAKGDNQSIMNYLTMSDRWRQNKFQNTSPKLTNTERYGLKKPPLQGSKTSTDISNYTTCKVKRHLVREGMGPLVSQKQFREWGVDPTILKAKESSKSKQSYATKDLPAKSRNLQTKRISRSYASNDGFRKTTSNLPLSFKKQIPAEESNMVQKVKQQFQSKSFVLPRRVVGRVKLDTITEYCSPRVSTQININKK